MSTTKAGETLLIARVIDLDLYSALIAAGGDGSYHEVINGMLARTDGKRLPVGFIPNGSGNDLCNSLGIMNVQDALDYIVSRMVMKFDVIRVLADHESEETVPGGNERFQYCRYVDINACMSVPAKIAESAEPYKCCCGKLSYTIATITTACCGNFVQDLYELEIDGVKVSDEGKDTI